MDEVKELKKLLQKCLEYEAEVARVAGLEGCTCIRLAQQTEIEYEIGECPHQKARAFLNLKKTRAQLRKEKIVAGIMKRAKANKRSFQEQNQYELNSMVQRQWAKQQKSER